MYSIEDYNYNLPEDLIAYHPVEPRHDSKMLVVNSAKESFELRDFPEIINFLNHEDCMVLNNTKVLKARLFGIKEKGSAIIEAMLINQLNNQSNIWESFIKPGKRVKEGSKIRLKESDKKTTSDFYITILNKFPNGTYRIQFNDKNINKILDICGEIPLPPYIKREPTRKDNSNYQTIYSKETGAVAAPTAGLHFTKDIFNKISNKGVNTAELTLHVGAGTFQPVTENKITEHKMHSEEYYLSENCANIINKTKQKRKNVLAVGTTTTRVLETVGNNNGFVKPDFGWTDIYIYPPYNFKVINMLLTNFHLPKSTLLMLVSAFANRELILEAYKFAIEKRLRFYSYGDCMLII